MARRGDRNRDVAASDSEVSGDVLAAAYAGALQWAIKRVDYDTAHDVASDVTLSVWARIEGDPSFLQGSGELDRFVVTAAKNALVDRVRGDRRRAQREAVFETACRQREHAWMSPEQEASYAELAGAYRDALEHTPLGRRVAYLLVHHEELSYNSVAEQLDLSPRAVESRVRRTRMELRRKLAAYGVGPARDAA